MFLATTRHGLVHASRAANGEWTVERLLDGQDVRCLAADPCDQHVIYAGSQGQGVLRSDDCGTTWRPAGLAGQIVTALALSRAAPDVVYAATKPPQLYVSRDGGARWTELAAFRRVARWWWFQPAEQPHIAFVSALALSPTDPRVIVAGFEAWALVRSTDGGQSWSRHCRGAARDPHALTFHCANGAWVYEAGGLGVAFSRDTGVTWRQPRIGLDRRYGIAVAADPERPEVWYASASTRFPLTAHTDGKANASIFRATAGAAWQKLAGGLPQPLPYAPYALLTDPAAPGHVYAGLSNGDVWHSTDYGDTWQQLPLHLGGVRPTLILL